jgi:hypothetical protein
MESCGASPRLPTNAFLERHRLGKQRSFTTSILVSPQSDRKFILPQKQHSMDDRKPDPNQRLLQSGEVEVQIQKASYLEGGFLIA